MKARSTLKYTVTLAAIALILATPGMVFAETAGAGEHTESSTGSTLFNIVLALLLVVVNGYFVAAEFALVKVRGSQIVELVRQGRPFAKTARWLAERLDGSLSACQLGITMASLALGWVGEPAFAAVLRPMLEAMGADETLVHLVAFTVGFTFITALHLVIGEQAPKIFAIRRPEQMVRWCALPLKFFYLATYPLMISLNWSTEIILRRLGVQSGGEHEVPHSEEEIKALLREAHVHGDLTRNEHRLINAVFEFDDMICRRVMVPRADVEFFEANASLSDCIEKARRSRHTRFSALRRFARQGAGRDPHQGSYRTERRRRPRPAFDGTTAENRS